MNQPSIRLNKVHNISVRMYVCTHGVIYLMYWYVYFNLFQDLILWLWPWNQYLHLWSTTFNQFCPCLLSTMHCLWLDTCKQSCSSLLRSFLALCVAVLWEVTEHSSLRLATGDHPRTFTLLSWPPSLVSSPSFHLPARAHDRQLCGCDSWKTKCTAREEMREAHAKQMLRVLSSVMSLFSFTVSGISAKMHDLIPLKYWCCVHGDMACHPFDHNPKFYSCQYKQRC